MKGEIFRNNIVAFPNIRKVVVLVYFLLLEQSIIDWMAEKEMYFSQFWDLGSPGITSSEGLQVA